MALGGRRGTRGGDFAARSPDAFLAPESDRRRSEVALVLVAALWGLTFPLIKGALDDASPMGFLAVRCPIALALLWPLCGRRPPARGSVLPGIGLGLLLAASYYLQTLGLVVTTATRSAFLTGLSVLLTPLLYPVLTRRRPGRRVVAGAAVSAAGLYLFTDPTGGGFNRGDGLTVAAAVVLAVYVIGLETATRKHAFESIALLQTAVLAAAFLPAPLLEGRFPDPTRAFLVGAVATGAIMAVTVYGLSRFQRNTTAVRAGVIYTGEPVFAALFAFLLLGETLDARGAAGAAVILAGILTAIAPGRRRPPRIDPDRPVTVDSLAS